MLSKYMVHGYRNGDFASYRILAGNAEKALQHARDTIPSIAWRESYPIICCARCGKAPIRCRCSMGTKWVIYDGEMSRHRLCEEDFLPDQEPGGK